MPQKSLWKNESLSAVGSSIIIMLVILIFGKVDLLTVSFAAGQDRLTVGYDKDLVGGGNNTKCNLVLHKNFFFILKYIIKLNTCYEI